MAKTDFTAGDGIFINTMGVEKYKPKDYFISRALREVAPTIWILLQPLDTIFKKYIFLGSSPVKLRLLILILSSCSLFSTAALAGIVTDNGNGTMTDTSTGLLWLKNSSCLGSTNWAGAVDLPKSLASPACNLADNSQAGDWRLPTKEELDSLIRGPGAPQMICSGDLCAIYNPAGENPNAWLTAQGFTSVQTGYYWTSTTVIDNSGKGWTVGMTYGIVNTADKISTLFVWPVRSVSTVTGTLSDSATASPLADTTVTVGTKSMQTDSAGAYTAIMAPGSYSVTATKSGYQSRNATVTTTTNQTIVRNFSLKPMIPVTISFTGAGSGTVSDAAAGLSCGSNCQNNFAWSTSLNLTPAPLPYSLFTGWSGAGCSGTGPCSLTVTALTTVTANFIFDTAFSVRQDATPYIYYPSLQNALDTTAGNAPLLAWGTSYAGGLNLTRAIAVKLYGGYTADYSLRTGVTTINGRLTVAKGSLQVDRVSIR